MWYEQKIMCQSPVTDVVRTEIFVSVTGDLYVCSEQKIKFSVSVSVSYWLLAWTERKI